MNEKMAGKEGEAMSDQVPDEFKLGMIRIGILDNVEQKGLFRIAKECASLDLSNLGLAVTGGAAAAAGWGAAATVMVGGFAVPVVAVGVLAGMASGTFACTAVNVHARMQLHGLRDDFNRQNNRATGDAD